MSTDREEFLAAAKEAGFEIGKDCEHCGGSGRVPSGREVVRALAGGFGADWDLDSVLEFIRDADEVRWVGPSVFRHDLLAAKGDRLVSFGVEQPKVAS